ncbi:LysR family transcriptional regulator ArgP [Leifsonia kafniensis]|uniref:LysR family transcriptional regulator ArgP n=1 Tax=Leifsonia kafniensis TaxID=475957 RepID=A0ABP7KT87_9MICO
MDLQLEQLRALVAVVDSGTFDAAATALRVTPSAISQRIKALELAVGRVLLQRVKPVRPTASGEVVLRLARQFALLENDALATLDPPGDTAADAGGAFLSIPIVINSDSLATWALPALAQVPAEHRVSFDVFREDQDHSTSRLRDGTVMAAITSVAEPVQGCIVRPLGRMRYRPMASPEFIASWLPDGPTVANLALAPVVIYDRTDDLQDRYLRQRTRVALHPPQHFIPASSEFASAVRLGLGWGMLPDAQSAAAEAAGDLVEFDPGAFIDVALYWQQWKLHSSTLAAVADAIAAAAAEHLR